MARAGQVAAGALLMLLAAVAPARAQYGRPSMEDPAIGEKYHVEAELNFFNPNLDAVVSSESLGILGSEINIKNDLGYVDKTIREFRLVLRPGRKHKFRIAYTPVKYQGDTLLARTIVFNGISYTVGLPVQTEFKWNTWRFGYEYDFVYTDRGYAGFIVEARQTDASLQLTSPVDDEFTRARGPIPAIGGTFRVYPVKHLAITGEFTGFKLPNIDNYQGDFFDIDIYTTYNFTQNFGLKGGYRTLDASYIADKDNGSLKLKGLYFAGLVRF
ncbi:MAG TPA: hypothetical protein VFG86_13155 [Chloroflexota bacterium]|nr:hypothetical protein [Chloroflexota bacterium]